MRYPDRLRLPFAFDAEGLAHDLSALAEAGWIAHFVKRNYEGDWSVIPLRGPKGATHPVQMIYSDPGCMDFEDTPILSACPYFQEVLAAFKCPLHAVRLMRLGPGAIIKEHSDNDLSFEDGMVRFHIPIVTNPDVEFLLNGDRVVLDAGTTWYLRLSDRHSVANRGAEPRVHMVVDAVADHWVAGLLDRALAATSEQGEIDRFGTASNLAPLPDAIDESCGTDVPHDFELLHQRVLEDVALRRRLGAIDDDHAFLSEVAKVTRSRGLDVSEHSLRIRMRRRSDEIASHHLPSDLTGWMPGNPFREDDELWLPWIYARNDRLDPSSFEASIRSASRRPFNRLFRHAAPISSLDDLASSLPDVPPTGFIFHMSRCGSTLLTRQLACLSDTIVVSEAGPVDSILQARLHHLEVREEDQARWLAGLFAAFRRTHDSSRLFVKFDCWHALHLPLIRQAFPSVPRVFLYRDPVEVLVSLMRRPGLHSVPGLLPGVFATDAEPASREEYAAKVLAEICEAGAADANSGALLVNYGEWPGTGAIARYFGVTPSHAELARISAVSVQDAKQPNFAFSPDGTAKQVEASPAMRAASEKWLTPVFRQLETMRLGSTPAARRAAERHTGGTSRVPSQATSGSPACT